ncbi:PP2C family protein-serine/threonine phosphatase [Paraoerskovia marina]|uniref:PP2C family protein-serine/threonine phosphatase n=1 Tax=Paraoerskovia marina TaxID=545619 RepID=UPI000A65B61F|nr:fused response regulator/phosphatase [Paraoerskovia marina]
MVIDTTGEGSGGSALVGADDELVVLLVEDDDGDAFLVTEHLADAALTVVVRRATTLDDAISTLGDRSVDCVLLDLGLPDAVGLDAVTRLRALPCAPALVVLTGLSGTDEGVRAVAAGADDYLVKGEVEPDLLGRSVRYAVQRRRSEAQQRAIYRSQIREAETMRLERALLPTPLVDDDDLAVLVGYIPGGNGLLGGDFYDAVELVDGRVVCLIGDVAGHGPDEAALGATLRTAWRTLVVSGTAPADVIGHVEHILTLERDRPEIFSTLCQVVVAPDRRSADLYLAGHLAPLLIAEGRIAPVPSTARGRAMGVPSTGGWQALTIPLAAPWSLLLYTDGLVEATLAGVEVQGLDGPRPRRARLGLDGLASTVERVLADGQSNVVERTLRAVRDVHGGPLDDDAAALLVGWAGPGEAGERASTTAEDAGWGR